MTETESGSNIWVGWLAALLSLVAAVGLVVMAPVLPEPPSDWLVSLGMLLGVAIAAMAIALGAWQTLFGAWKERDLAVNAAVGVAVFGLAGLVLGVDAYLAPTMAEAPPVDDHRRAAQLGFEDLQSTPKAKPVLISGTLANDLPVVAGERIVAYERHSSDEVDVWARPREAATPPLTLEMEGGRVRLSGDYRILSDQYYRGDDGFERRLHRTELVGVFGYQQGRADEEALELTAVDVFPGDADSWLQRYERVQEQAAGAARRGLFPLLCAALFFALAIRLQVGSFSGWQRLVPGLFWGLTLSLMAWQLAGDWSPGWARVAGSGSVALFTTVWGEMHLHFSQRQAEGRAEPHQLAWLELSTSKIFFLLVPAWLLVAVRSSWVLSATCAGTGLLLGTSLLFGFWAIRTKEKSRNHLG